MANYTPEIPKFPTVNPFLPCYGKFDLTTYIQGASDYEIMANLVQLYNTMASGYNSLKKLSTDTVEAFNQLQDFVNKNVANLPAEVQIALQKMLNNGTLQTLVNTVGLAGHNTNPKIALTVGTNEVSMDILKNYTSGIILYTHLKFNTESKEFYLDETSIDEINSFLQNCLVNNIHLFGLKFHDEENHVELCSKYTIETVFNAYKTAVLNTLNSIPVQGEYVWIYNEKENLRTSVYSQYFIGVVSAIKQKYPTIKVSSPYAYPSAYNDCDSAIKNSFDCQSFNIYPVPPQGNIEYYASIYNTAQLYNFYYDIINNHDFEIVVTEFGNCASWDGYKAPANYYPGTNVKALACGFFGALNSKFSKATLMAPWWTNEFITNGLDMFSSVNKGVNVYYGNY